MNRSLILSLALACGERADQSPASAPAPVTAREEAEPGWGGEGGGLRLAEKSAAPMGASARGDMMDKPDDGIAFATGGAPPEDEADNRDGKKENKGGAGEGEPAATRSWFPESFLWMPSVETDASGSNTVTVAVPDSLTTWRVLGLGWTRDGAQGGAEVSVVSTLPAYVDVVVPGSLYAGDVVELPVQVVNTTGETLSAGLDVLVSGASGAGAGALSVPGGGSATRSVSVQADRAGTAVVKATFGNIDGVERAIPVRPNGLPLDTKGSGAVGGAVTAIAQGAASADDSLEIILWSGAASVVRAEIEGGGVEPWERDVRIGSPLAQSAYQFALSQAGAKLSKEDVSPEALRTLRIRSWQPLTRAARVPDVATACLLAEALRGAPDKTIEGDLRDRMVEQARSTQAPDGTWVTGLGTIDSTLAQTGACSLAAGADDSVRLRAEGAFARNVQRLEDPYLAAWALASGAVSDPELTTRLRDTLSKALVHDNDGAHLHVAGMRRADGAVVNDAEATAVAALALADNHDEAAALATGLLALRQPWGGWGDGVASLLALRALDAVFTMDQPPALDVELVLDGVVAATGRLSTELGHKPTRLVAPWTGSAAKLEVRTSTPAPGLIYTWRARSWSPWGPPEAGAAEVSVTAPRAARVGEVVSVAVRAATPSSVSPTLRVGLPAGVRPDPAGMDALVARSGFASWQGGEGFVLIRGLPPGGWEGELPVVPALAGSLTSGASTLLDDTTTVALAPPSRWTIAR